MGGIKYELVCFWKVSLPVYRMAEAKLSSNSVAVVELLYVDFSIKKHYPFSLCF